MKGGLGGKKLSPKREAHKKLEVYGICMVGGVACPRSGAGGPSWLCQKEAVFEQEMRALRRLPSEGGGRGVRLRSKNLKTLNVIGTGSATRDHEKRGGQD